MPPKRTIPQSDDTLVYYGGPNTIPTSFSLGRAFESIPLSAEHMRINMEWADRLRKGKIKIQYILSEAAAALIAQRCRDWPPLASGEPEPTEPAYMQPSVDPQQYSKWCSYCFDFATTLLPCAGCRTAVCVNTPQTSRGCAIWQECVEATTFVFHCKGCSRRQKIPCPVAFRNPDAIPERHSILFRYDAPALIIYVRWHETERSFGKLLRDHLYLNYAGNEDSLMLIERPLNATPRTQGAHSTNVNDKHYKVTADLSVAEAFLVKHSTAKIVFIVDTHCLENGYFVYKGASPKTYEACSLLEILRDCSPDGVFKYLSNDDGTPQHAHKSIIINLACGATISKPGPRSELLDGHCSDVLSLANDTTVVGTVAPTLLDFIAYWVQSPSTYDAIFSKAIPPQWAQVHQPVLSRHGHVERRFTKYKGPEPSTPPPPPPANDHILYTKFSFGQPRGLLSPCYRRCGRGTDSKQAGNSVHLTCNGCFEEWWVPTYRTEDSTPLGHGLVAVPYPQGIYPRQTLNRNERHQPESTRVQKQSRGASSKGKHTMGGPTKGGSSKVKPTNTKTTHRPTLPTNATLHPPLPEAMGRSNSLPITSTTANPRSSRLSIRLPPRPTSTSGLSVQGLSPSDGSRSATATPPPPSPQEPPVARRTASSNSLRTAVPRPAQKRASNSALRPRAAKRPKPEEGDED